MSHSNLRTVILVTGLITALVHGVLLSIQLGEPSVLFILNGIGYLALLAAFWFRPAFLANRSALLHYALIGYAALTILAWIPAGSRTLTGFATKLDELILVYALFAHLRAEKPGT